MGTKKKYFSDTYYDYFKKKSPVSTAVDTVPWLTSLYRRKKKKSVTLSIEDGNM